MTSQLAGIDIWATAIRLRMANDPGRQDLDDHILCNGFLFLDEYLEDIFLGARTDPIIELTKTPGRRKDASKKVRATAATVNILPLRSPDKENIPILRSPVVAKVPTSFQKALLKVSRENESSRVESQSFRSPRSLNAEHDNPFGLAVGCSLRMDHEEEEEEETVKELVTPPLSRTATYGAEPIRPSVSVFPSPNFGPQTTSHLVDAGVELSIIAEGDENEISRTSVPTSQPMGPIIRDNEISYHIPQDPNNPDGPMATVTVSYDPNGDDDDDTQSFPVDFNRSFDGSEPTSTATLSHTDPYARDYDTHELPRIVAEHSVLPIEQLSHPQSPLVPTLTRKTSVPVFPSLPAPSPLPNPTRDSSVHGPLYGNARQSVVAGNPGGTRTSWLSKARDVTAKRSSVANGVKRKSGDLTVDADYIAQSDGYHKAAKVAKTGIEGRVSPTLLDIEKPHMKVTIQPFKAVIPLRPKEHLHEPPIAHVTTPEGNSEGMINILKRTVEGLGARVGKTMGKSLGGAAATAAAAEAKAAAEARLAQREAKVSDGSRQGKLSVSDLVITFENGGSSNVKEVQFSNTSQKSLPSPPPLPVPYILTDSRTSISTTPPHSPPIIRQPFAQISPSFEPVISIIPKFTVQRHTQRMSSFTLPESQPSTQSTYISSIFDDHSTRPRSSFGTEYTASQGFSQPKVSSRDTAPTDEYKVPNLAKEVDWAQCQTGSAEAAIKAVTEDYSALPPQRYLNAQDTSIRLPGSFALDDSEVEVVHHPDIEEDGSGGSVFVSSETVELKAKDAHGQELSIPQTSFVAQASTLFSKVMGSSVGGALSGSKRGKPEPVKSIQLAAAAAKRQQEEADRKAARLREMDKRRAAIASKKANQEAAEKSKHQGDRRKREREEGTDKKVTRATIRKAEEEVSKKRKVFVEIEKKLECKRPLSKDKKDLGSSRIGKHTLKVSPSQSQLSYNGMSKSFKQPGLPASASQPCIKLVATNQDEPQLAINLLKPVSGQSKEREPANSLEDVRQPSQALHAQMQARVQAQILQARQEESNILSESIELPDINSEYSNSDDEDRPRTFDPPDWAQSPVLGLALQSQSRLNPDDIFGPVKPLHMEEIFTTRHSRFRARTSSANWAGADELTTDEEKAYAKRMGYLD